MSENENVVEIKRRQTRKPKPGVTVTQGVLLEVETERQAQDAKWGEQNHAQQGGDVPLNALKQYRALAGSWQTINDQRTTKDNLGFDGILLEEVYEALAEEDTTRRREELVQVAAVAVAMIEAIDRANELPDAA